MPDDLLPLSGKMSILHDMKSKPTISIIGPGVVGSTLGRTLRRVGYTIAAVAGGSDETRTAELARAIDASDASTAQAAAAGELVLLSVPDAAIQRVCDQLAAAGALGHRPMLAHCSGALDTSVLQSARDAGCAVGSMHPLQTFPSVEAAIARLPGTWWFIEGDEAALPAMDAIATHTGGRAVRIDPAGKAIYHAAAVMSANYLTTVLDAALEMYERVGLDRDIARKAIAPIVRATVENVLQHDTADALSGPIARGDVETVDAHLTALDTLEGDFAALYRRIGLRTVRIARRRGSIDDAMAANILALLESKD
jgi:predicted short-subunit dehydrogenase-like oxidoreductase (DUF2520 family)